MRSSGVRVRVLLALVVVLAGFLSQVGRSAAQTPTASTDSNATFAKSDCPWTLPDTLKQGDTIRCGFVTVPLFHDDPNGDTIKLAVGVISPDDGKVSGDPVFILNGGPGGDSSAVISVFKPDRTASLNDAREGREIVVFDQRGTGASEPGLYCPGDYNDTTGETTGGATPEPQAATAEATDSDAEAAARDCAKRLDRMTDLTAFTTAESARDINDIRVAMGYDHIQLWGESYGTRLALEAMRTYPAGVIDSVVLESVLPPDTPFLSSAILGFNDAFSGIARACQKDQRCNRSYPDLPTAFADAVKYFNEHPHKTSFKDASTGQKTPIIVDGSTFSFLVYQVVFSGLLIPIVPKLITDAAGGDTSLVDQLLPLLSASGVATGFYYSVLCQDELPNQTEQQYQHVLNGSDILPVVQDTQLGESGSSYYAACKGFDLPATDAADRDPVTSDIPTLLVTGQFDPITPPSNAAHAAETLSHSYNVVAGGLAHTPIVLSQDCLLAGTIDFLNDPNREPDFGCARDNQINFV